MLPTDSHFAFRVSPNRAEVVTNNKHLTVGPGIELSGQHALYSLGNNAGIDRFMALSE